MVTPRDQQMTRLHQQLAQGVLEALATEGLTQSDLAKRAGITQKHLSLILSGSATGSLEMWNRLATVLGRQWECTAKPVT